MCEAFSAWVVSAAGTDVRYAEPMGNLWVEKGRNDWFILFLSLPSLEGCSLHIELDKQFGNGDKVRQASSNKAPIVQSAWPSIFHCIDILSLFSPFLFTNNWPAFLRLRD